MICGLAFAGTVIAQESDLSVVVTDSGEAVVPDATVSFEVEVANAGPDESPNSVIMDVYLPMEVPVPYRDYLAADEDGRLAIANAFLDSVQYDENIWDPDDEEGGVYVGDSRNNACQGMILQFYPLTLPAGTSGKVYYDAAVPEVGAAGFTYQKADGEMVYPEFKHTACAASTVFEDCGDATGVFCMGARLTTVVASGAPITLVDDGSDLPSEGCGALVDFPVGNVALVDRGTCGFQDKVKNASEAGASGVIVANFAGGGDVDEDGLIYMGCNSDATCIELLISAPAVSISFNSGVALKAAMAEGEVHGFVGIRQEEPNFAATEGYIWESGGTSDTNPDNDRFTLKTVFGAEQACTPIYIAAAAAGAGANNSMWSTDLGINNSSTDEVLKYKFQMLPRGADNTDVAFTDEFMVQPNTNANFVDVWKLYTGGDGAGAINVCVSNPEIAGVTSRTYNTSDEGTFGQAIVGMKGVTPEKLIATGEIARLGFLSQNSAFRTNLGFMNAGANAITINAEFFTADGTSLGTASIDLPPFSNNQWTRAFRQVTTDNVDLGYIDVYSDTADASFLTYASVVDNNTGDPTTIWPFNTSQAVGGGSFDCTPVWVAAAAKANGAGGTTWATDLGINNLGSDPLTYKFQFLPRDADNTDVTMSESFTLAGNGSIAYRDIWDMTGANGAGAINVCVDNGDNAGVLSRTFNTGDAGTFGQMIEGMRGAAPAKVGTGEKVRLGYLFENDAYRTNIGFMNAGANEIVISADFYNRDGTYMGNKSVTLAPYSNTQWNKAYTLAPIFGNDIAAGFVDVWSDTADANFLTYASIVDNGTGDPTTIWPF
jgi:hypothetical protein